MRVTQKSWPTEEPNAFPNHNIWLILSYSRPQTHTINTHIMGSVSVIDDRVCVCTNINLWSENHIPDTTCHILYCCLISIIESCAGDRPVIPFNRDCCQQSGHFVVVGVFVCRSPRLICRCAETDGKSHKLSNNLLSLYAHARSAYGRRVCVYITVGFTTEHTSRNAHAQCWK